MSGDRASLEDLALASARCSTGDVTLVDGTWVPQGDTMEAALVALAVRLGVDPVADRSLRPDVRRFPFDPRRRRMSVQVGDRLLVKGAPDSVLPRCVGDTGPAHAALDRMTARGLRVLAIASRDLDPESVGAGPADAGRWRWTWACWAWWAWRTRPGPGSATRCRDCRDAGIRVAMVTGDHPATARTIAREIGLLGAEGVVVEGTDLPGRRGWSSGSWSTGTGSCCPASTRRTSCGSRWRSRPVATWWR